MTMWVHWVNAHDSELGRMTLAQAHERKLLHRVGAIFICNEKNEILLAQRAKDHAEFAGLTDASVSFHLNAEETLAEAGKRELFAKTGLRLTPQFVGFGVLDRDPEHVIVHVFELAYDGMARMDPKHAPHTRYLPFEEIERGLPYEPTVPYLPAAWKVYADAKKRQTQKTQRDAFLAHSKFLKK